MSSKPSDGLTAGTSGRPRRSRKGEEMRRALIEAAIECLTTLGYAGTSVEAVMARAGVSRGSVLHQFPTRIALMAATIEAAMESMVVDTRARMNAIGDPAQRFHSMCDVYWETQNLPVSAAVTEVLLAARWDRALAEALRPVAGQIEIEIDQYAADLARDAGAGEADIDACIVHARILILSLRGITLELMYDRDRTIIHRALDQLRVMHHTHCDQILAGR